MSCPICRNDRLVEFFRSDERTLLICSTCRHISWREMPTVEDLAAYYGARYTGEHGQYAVQNEHLEYYRGHAFELATALEAVPASLAIADVGCSYPVFLEQALHSGYRRVVGVDYSTEAAEYGAARGIEVISPEVFDLQADETFDILRYSHALEHMIDPSQILSKQIRKLKIGGLLYITQPNFPVFKDGPGMKIKDCVWPTHLHYFNPISLQFMIEDSGARPSRFYTVAGESDSKQLYESILDVDYARDKCVDLSQFGESARGLLNNFPEYTGENSTMFALRVA